MQCDSMPYVTSGSIIIGGEEKSTVIKSVNQCFGITESKIW